VVAALGSPLANGGRIYEGLIEGTAKAFKSGISISIFLRERVSSGVMAGPGRKANILLELVKKKVRQSTPFHHTSSGEFISHADQRHPTLNRGEYYYSCLPLTNTSFSYAAI
jgi:hypothetical protein